MQILFTALFLISGSLSEAAVCSRTLTFTDGSVLTAAQLNDEFNAAINCTNSIDNSNISLSANIDPVKIGSTIAGDGIGRNGGTGALNVNVDGVTIETSGDAIRVKDAGISAAKLATDSVTTVKILNANVTAAKMATDSIATASIQDGAVTSAKRAAVNTAASALVASVSSSAGSFVDATGLTLNITTTGKPVVVFLGSGDVGLNAFSITVPPASNYFQLMRDGAAISSFRTVGGTSTFPTQFLTIDTAASAGLHTYKLQYRAAGGTITIFNAKLFAHEL